MSDYKTSLDGNSMQDELYKVKNDESKKLDAIEKKLLDILDKLHQSDK